MASSVGIQHQPDRTSSSPVQVPDEADIVRSCYHGPPISNGDQITAHKYVMNSAASFPTMDKSWVDGELFCYMKWQKDWSPTGVKVKFYVMGSEYNAEAKRKEVYVWADEIKKISGLPNILTPLFATYNPHVKRVVVCYPYFDLQLKDWLPGNKAPAREENLLPIWNNLIRALIHCIPTLQKLKIKGFGGESSFVWVKQPDEIKLVFLPEDKDLDGSYFSNLAHFLRCCLLKEWNNPDLRSFIILLERVPEVDLHCIAAHPLLHDLDDVSHLIRTTWRSPNSLIQAQTDELNKTITTKWGNDPWQWLVFNCDDPILKEMLGDRSDDAIGLFTYVKEICAHYNENHRKKFKQPGEHHVLVIKGRFPGLISDIYKLSLSPEWLEKH